MYSDGATLKSRADCLKKRSENASVIKSIGRFGKVCLKTDVMGLNLFRLAKLVANVSFSCLDKGLTTCLSSLLPLIMVLYQLG